MQFKKGQVVYSTSGHDKGELSVVMGIEDKRVLLCDGKHHKAEKPKKKNPKHIKACEFILSDEFLEKNKVIRKTLNKIANPRG